MALITITYDTCRRIHLSAKNNSNIRAGSEVLMILMSIEAKATDMCRHRLPSSCHHRRRRRRQHSCQFPSRPFQPRNRQLLHPCMYRSPSRSGRRLWKSQAVLQEEEQGKECHQKEKGLHLEEPPR